MTEVIKVITGFLSCLLNPKAMSDCTRVLATKQSLSDDIKSGKLKWEQILAIYSQFMIWGSVVVYLTFDHYGVEKDVSWYKVIFYYTLSNLLVAGILMIPFIRQKGRLTYEQTLMFTFLLFGGLFLMNSILLVFNMKLLEGTIWYVVFVPAVAVIVWTLFFWKMIFNANEAQGKLYFTTSVVLIACLFGVIKVFTGPLADVLLSITN